MGLLPYSSSTPQATFTNSGKVKQTVYNALDYGLKGDGSDETTAINAFLASHAGSSNNPNRLIFPSGYNFAFSTPLVIYSYTILDARGATITELPGSNCNMINNAGYTANRSGVDAATISNSTTVTSTTANFTAADIGSTIAINGAGPANAHLFVLITAIISSTQCTIAVAAGSTISNQNWSIYRRDSHIELWGGYWNRGTNGTSGFVYGNSINLRHLDWLYVHDLTHYGTLGKNKICVGDVTNYTIENIELKVPIGTLGQEDGIHLLGPAQYVKINNIHGVSGDDFVALTPADNQSFNDTVGDIKNVDITALFPSNTSLCALKLIGGYGTLMRDISVRGIHGQTVYNGISIWDDTSGPMNVENVVIEDVDVIPGSGYSLAEINCSQGKSLIFRNISWRSTLDTQDVFKLDGTIGMTSLIIDGLTIENGTNLNLIHVTTSNSLSPGIVNCLSISKLRILNSSITAKGVVVDATPTVNRIIFNDIDAIMANNSNALLSVSGHVTYSEFNNINLKGGGQLISLSSTADSLTALANNVILDNAYQIANTSVGLTMSLTNCYATPTQSQLFQLFTVNSTLSIYGKGLVNPNNITCFSRDGTQTPRILHPEMRVDTTTIAANLGDSAYNTNSGISTGPGPVIYNGTSWEPIALPQNLYTSSTPQFNGVNLQQASSGAEATELLLTNTGGSVGSDVSISLQPGNLATARAKIRGIAPGGSDAQLAFYTSHSNGAPVQQMLIDGTGNITHVDAANFSFGTSTGTKIGTATNQKISFFNATPVIQQSGDIITALSNLGLITSGTISGSDLTVPIGFGIAASGNGSLQVIAGNSSQAGKVGGTIFDHFADTGNTHTDGATYDDLYSDTTPASILNANGDKLIADYSGIFAASATATREIKVLFAGTTILDTGALTAAAAEAWDVDVFIIRESSTVVRCMVKIVSSTPLGAGAFNDITYTRITGLTLSGTNILKIQAVSGSAGAAANDIVAKLGTIRWDSAA